MILVIDNYDSFTYNLVDILRCYTDVLVARNDQISLAKIVQQQPNGILISPGPGTPEDSGISQQVVAELSASIPILGVCLGHQLIGQWHGAELREAPRPMHGRTSLITHDQKGVFNSLPIPLRVMRYHSLILDAASIPAQFTISATTDDGLVMGIRHNTIPLTGVQFHPESILSEGGKTLLYNWLTQIRVI